MTYELHDRPNCTLDVDSIVSINRDEARRTAQQRQLNESGIVTHDGLEFLRPFRDHPVQLAGKDGCITRKKRL